MNGEYHATIGMDVSDRTTKVCVMSKEGGARRILEKTTIPTTGDGLRAYLSGKGADWPVVFETGAHCRWMRREVESLGMRAIVASPSRLRMVTESDTKDDRNDARDLARLALADAELLHPVRLRGERCQQALRLLKARDMLVKVRTMHVNELRGFAKSMGFRLPDCPANRAHAMDRSGRPADFEAVAWPLMGVLETVDVKTRACEAQVRALVRRLMVEAAQIALRSAAKDTDAKLRGERMCARGGRIAKRKALVAVARCLVVTAAALLKRPDAKYVPLSEAARREFEAMRASEA